MMRFFKSRSERPTHQIIVVVAAVLIAGCSPRVFERETAGFRDAAIGVENIWVGLHDKLDSLKEAEREYERVRDDWEFSVSEHCANFASVLANPPRTALDDADIESRRELVESCMLFRRGTDQSVLVEPVDRRLLPFAEAISEYASALAMLTAAEDEAAFRMAAAEASASVDVLEQLSDIDIGISGAISTLASLYGEIRLAGIERRKYNTLREVVENTDNAIQNMTQELAKVEALQRELLLQAQYSVIQKAEEDLRSLTPCSPPAERRKRQQTVIDRLLDYRSYARTLVLGGVSYSAVGEAHARLLDAVQSPNDSQLAWLAVERLKSIGETAREAVAALGLKN